MAKSFGVGSIVAKVEADIRGFTRNMNTVRDTMNEMRKNGVTSKAALGAVGTAAAAMGVAGAMGINKVVQTAGEYNDAMKQMQLMTGDTTAVMKENGESVRKLFKEGIGKSYDEIARPFARAKTYFKNTNEDIEDMTRKALQMQTAFGVDPENTLKAVSRMVTSFDISGSDAYDMIIKTMQEGGGDPGEVIDTFNEYAHDLATAGFSAQDLADRMIYGMQHGGAFNVDKIGDIYREFMDKAKDVTPDMIESLRHLYGKDELQQVLDNLRSGGKATMAQLDDLIVKIGNTEDKFMKRNLMEIFFGSPGTDLGNQFFEEYEKVAEMQTDFAGAMDKSWDSYAVDNFALSIQQLKAAFTDLMTTLGVELLPTVLGFIQALTKMINKLNEFLNAKEGRAAVAAWGFVIGTILAFITSAIAFGMLFWSMFGKAAIVAFGNLKTIFTKIPSLWKSLVSRFSLASISAWFTRFIGFISRGITLLVTRFNPIVAALMLGIGLIKLLYNTLRKVFGKDIADVFLKMIFPILGIVEILKYVLKFFTNLLPEGIRGFANDFLEVINTILRGATLPVQMLANLISGDTLNPFKIIAGSGNQNITINTNNLDNSNAGSVGGKVARELKGQSLGMTT